jgi:hypothetical protein
VKDETKPPVELVVVVMTVAPLKVTDTDVLSENLVPVTLSDLPDTMVNGLKTSLAFPTVAVTEILVEATTVPPVQQLSASTT